MNVKYSLYALSLALAQISLSSAAPPPPTAEQLAVGEALTGWGNVKWGQSSEEVQAAFEGKLVRRDNQFERKGNEIVPRGPVRITLRLEPFEIVGVPMEVILGFGIAPGKLGGVHILPIVAPVVKPDFLSKTCAALEVPLTIKYGPPTESKDDAKSASRDRIWNFRFTKIRLNYLKLTYAEICWLTYSPTRVTGSDLNKL